MFRRLGRLAVRGIIITIIAAALNAPMCVRAGTVYIALSTISSVTRLDLSEGKIYGDKAAYTLNIPQIWAGYLIADREKLINSPNLLEKINFYYQPQANYSKPVFLMSFLVYTNAGWSDRSGYTKILTSKNNVFADQVTSYNPFANTTDRALFARFITDASDADFMYKMISLPANNKEVAYNRIRVNGNLVKGASAFSEDGVSYIPVRRVCEFMGYKVSWAADTRAVIISGKGLYVVFLTNATRLNQGFVVKMVGGVTYVSSMFFVQNLNSSLEIDENNNVLITN